MEDAAPVAEHAVGIKRIRFLGEFFHNGYEVLIFSYGSGFAFWLWFLGKLEGVFIIGARLANIRPEPKVSVLIDQLMAFDFIRELTLFAGRISGARIVTLAAFALHPFYRPFRFRPRLCYLAAVKIFVYVPGFQ